MNTTVYVVHRVELVNKTRPEWGVVVTMPDGEERRLKGWSAARGAGYLVPPDPVNLVYKAYDNGPYKEYQWGYQFDVNNTVWGYPQKMPRGQGAIDVIASATGKDTEGHDIVVFWTDDCKVYRSFAKNALKVHEQMCNKDGGVFRVGYDNTETPHKYWLLDDDQSNEDK